MLAAADANDGQSARKHILKCTHIYRSAVSGSIARITEPGAASWATCAPATTTQQPVSGGVVSGGRTASAHRHTQTDTRSVATRLVWVRPAVRPAVRRRCSPVAPKRGNCFWLLLCFRQRLLAGVCFLKRLLAVVLFPCALAPTTLPPAQTQTHLKRSCHSGAARHAGEDALLECRARQKRGEGDHNDDRPAHERAKVTIEATTPQAPGATQSSWHLQEPQAQPFIHLRADTPRPTRLLCVARDRRAQTRTDANPPTHPPTH